MENPTPQPNIPSQPTKNWFLRHEILYSVIGALLLIVIAGAIYWWLAIKDTEVSQTEFPLHKAQTETLAGVDADHNGVRDDVDKYIVETYSNSASTRLALIQEAKSIQKILVNADNPTTLPLLWNESIDNVHCLRDIVGTEIGNQYDKLLEAKILNTDARIRAYYKAADHPAAIDVQKELNNPSPAKYSTCKFDPNSVSDSSPDTSTWKTYTNSQYGFEFKYPSNLIFDIKATHDFGLIITGDYSNMNMDEWIKSAKKYDQEVGEVSTYTPITVGGVSGVSVHYSGRSNEAGEVHFIKNSKDYDFVFKTVDQKTSDQILSTFKFTK